MAAPAHRQVHRRHRMNWTWDNPKQREELERRYSDKIHQMFIDAHPDFIPGCPCHPMTREARIELRKLKEKP